MDRSLPDSEAITVPVPTVEVFWFFIGKILSKTFFENEGQLEWFNAVRVRTREFIAFTNTQVNIDKANLQVVEIDFVKPQPNENLKLFFQNATKTITRNCGTHK
ncbi:hypothetical protein N7488_000037 [Penicillium malachiteum]|nr:hypothetical protein N7488_000037 [Penicillium malachiteum]